jgi:hypothetical protein
MNTTESNDMKDLWRDENKRLERRLKVNETIVRDLTVTNAATRYENLLTLSIWGRNLALVYCVISIVYATRTFDAPIYSVPTMFGALTMFCSFVSHWSLKRVDFAKLTVVELQKSICAFRTHTEKMKMYDFWIVVFWLVTLAPAWLKASLNLPVYNNPRTIIVLSSLLAIMTLIIYLVTRFMYADYNKKLKNSEEMLASIKQFEVDATDE